MMKNNSPKIFIDHQIFTIQTFGGISRLFSELFKRFVDGDLLDSSIPIIFSENEYIKNNLKTKSFFKGRSSFLKVLVFYFVNRIYSTLKLIQGNYDIFQPTYYDPYFLPFLKGKPFVLFIHDMTHEIFPENVSKRDKTILWKKKVANKAAKIIAISENTKKDIVRFYDIDPSNVEVVYLATSLELSNKQVDIKLPDRYILYVGKRDIYKNFKLFFNAITPLLKEDSSLCLLCAGSSGFTEEEKNLFEKTGLQDRVRHIRFKDDTELSYIYNNALCFVFPSLYEGFGIPVLEAFACNCPVVLSNSSSLPEVGGDAVEYVDASSKESIMKGVRKVIFDNELREGLRSKGRERLRMFSWDNTAEKVLEIYNSIL